MFFRSVPSVSWSEIEKNGKIIDVREPYEFKEHHVKGSKNVPLDRIDSYKSNSKVYVVCATGMRSKQAVIYLRKKGIDAINVKGGMMFYDR